MAYVHPYSPAYEIRVALQKYFIVTHGKFGSSDLNMAYVFITSLFLVRNLGHPMALFLFVFSTSLSLVKTSGRLTWVWHNYVFFKLFYYIILLFVKNSGDIFFSTSFSFVGNSGCLT